MRLITKLLNSLWYPRINGSLLRGGFLFHYFLLFLDRVSSNLLLDILANEMFMFLIRMLGHTAKWDHLVNVVSWGAQTLMCSLRNVESNRALLIFFSWRIHSKVSYLQIFVKHFPDAGTQEQGAPLSPRGDFCFIYPRLQPLTWVDGHHQSEPLLWTSPQTSRAGTQLPARPHSMDVILFISVIIIYICSY